MDFNKIISITGLVFALMTLVFNFIRTPFNIPGDVYIDRVGMKFYIPVLSTIVISVIITILFSTLTK